MEAFIDSADPDIRERLCFNLQKGTCAAYHLQASKEANQRACSDLISDRRTCKSCGAFVKRMARLEAKRKVSLPKTRRWTQMYDAKLQLRPLIARFAPSQHLNLFFLKRLLDL